MEGRREPDDETGRLLDQQSHVEIMEYAQVDFTPRFRHDDLEADEASSGYGLDQTTCLIVMASGFVVGFLIGTFLVG